MRGRVSSGELSKEDVIGPRVDEGSQELRLN